MKLSVIGVGLNCNEHLTILALKKILNANAVMTLGNYEFLNDIISDKKIISLNHLYINDDRDQNNYNRIISFAVENLPEYKTAALLIPGHPRIGVTLTQELEQICRKNKFQFEAINGISSFDTMINDLQLDPLENGTMLLDVNRMLLYNIPLINKLDLFLYHPSSTATPYTNYVYPYLKNRIDILKDYLLKFYKKTHFIYLISSSIDSNTDFFLYKTKIDNLLNSIDKITFSTSLFVPAISNKRPNQKFLKLLLDL